MRDILGIAVAVVIALLSQIVEPRSPLWWTAIIAAGLVAVSVAGHLVWRAIADHRGQTRRMAAIIGMIVCAVGFVGFAGWFFIQKPTAVVPTTLASTDTPATGVVAPITSFDDSISIECEMVLPQIPVASPDGQVNELNLFPIAPEQGGGGYGQRFGPANSPIKFVSDDLTLVSLYKCQVRNYGKIPVFNAKFFLFIRFMNAIKSENAAKLDSLKFERPWEIKINRLEADPDRPFVLYVYNISEAVGVYATLPSVIELQPLGETKPQTARLIVSGPQTMTFFPPFARSSPTPVQNK